MSWRMSSPVWAWMTVMCRPLTSRVTGCPVQLRPMPMEYRVPAWRKVILPLLTRVRLHPW